MRPTSQQAKDAKDTAGVSPQRSQRGLELVSMLPEPPEGLDEVAQRSWKQYGQLAIDLGVLTPYDLPALEMLARAAAMCVQLEKSVATDGPIIRSGGPTERMPNALYTLKQNPALAALAPARQQVLKFLAQFGLTPLGRESLSIERGKTQPDAKSQSEVDAEKDFMSRLQQRRNGTGSTDDAG